MRKRFIFFLSLQIVSCGVIAQKVTKNDLAKLTENLNSRWDEQNPILSPDGKSLYFSRANDSLNVGGPRDKGDIWFSRLSEDGIWSVPENLGQPVNDYLKNYLLGFSPDGNIMFLNQEKRNPGGLIINDGISYSVFSGGSWSKPARLSVDYLLNKSQHQSGSISADGTLMFLSLQSYASRGEEDIYISRYSNGKWTQPINLGSEINTEGQEMTPYLSPDKNSIYFASNGHGGRGGVDLYVAERTGEDWTSWSKPKNMGTVVNSSGVELSYFIDPRNEIAYLSSTQNSDGYGDIVAIDINIDTDQIPVISESFEELVNKAEEARKSLRLSGKVLNERTDQPVAGALNIKLQEGEENINTNQNDGAYELEIPLTEQSITITVKSPGFMSKTEHYMIEGEDIVVDFSLTPLEVGETIQLNKVYFERGTSELKEDSFEELDRVVDMMNENPSVKIELSGHTDNQGSSKLNVKLSQERVEKVKRYLSEHGVDDKRVKGKGYGGLKPVASNASEETRKLNRRVEITILKN